MDELYYKLLAPPILKGYPKHLRLCLYLTITDILLSGLFGDIFGQVVRRPCLVIVKNKV